MPNETGSLDIALIGEDRRRLALLRQEIQQRGPSCRIRTLNAAQALIAPSTGSGKDSVGAADLLIVDFAGPETARLSWIHALAIGARRTRIPVVILTSGGSENLLRCSVSNDADVTMFSPTTLSAFMRGLQQTQSRFFMKALYTLYDFGPILVRLPDSALPKSERCAELSA